MGVEKKPSSFATGKNGIMKLHTMIDINSIHFSSVRENKTNNQKAIYMSTVEGSSDPSTRIEVQLAPSHKEFVPRSKFGVDSSMNSDPYNRTVSLSVEDPSLLEWLKQLEDRVIQVGCEKSMDLWGKQMDEAQVRERFKPMLSCPSEDKPGYSPLLKVKMQIHNEMKSSNEQPLPTSFFVVDLDDPQSTDIFPNGRLEMHSLEYESEDPTKIICKNSKVLPLVRFSIWKSSIGFGISCRALNMILWPSNQATTALESMNLGGAVVTVTSKKRTYEEYEDQ